MAPLDPRLLDAAAARLVAATSRGEAAPPTAVDVLATTAGAWRGLHYAVGGRSEATVGLVDGLSRLGHAQVAAGQPIARQTLAAAVTHRRTAPPPASDTAPLARDLAMLGAVQMMVVPEAAGPALAESVELHRALAEADPQRWLGPLARCLLALATLHADQGRVSDARAVIGDLIDLAAPPAPVDLGRDAFLRPFTALLDRIAPPDDSDPVVIAMRRRVAALWGI